MENSASRRGTLGRAESPGSWRLRFLSAPGQAPTPRPITTRAGVRPALSRTISRTPGTGDRRGSSSWSSVMGVRPGHQPWEFVLVISHRAAAARNPLSPKPRSGTQKIDPRASKPRHRPDSQRASRSSSSLPSSPRCAFRPRCGPQAASYAARARAGRQLAPGRARAGRQLAPRGLGPPAPTRRHRPAS